MLSAKPANQATCSSQSLEDTEITKPPHKLDKPKVNEKAKDKMNHTKVHEGAQHNFIVITRRQVFLLFTCTEGSMRPSATKRGYTISYIDLSKSAVESEPSRAWVHPRHG
jgi:2-polyprenyl-3-methyl-5-hydroxy-6-metoxy-1,4-benzoquinol methylase